MLIFLHRAARCALLAVLSIGCASQREIAVSGSPAARGLPDHFLVGAHTDPGFRQEPRAGEGCRNPLVDPQDGTRLTLVRSSGGRGDYSVAAGRYNVGRRELLRVECATGRPVGIVRQ